MSASAYKLNKLVAIVDKNGKQAQGMVRERFDLDPIAEKWAAFGWNVVEIDGHCMEDILRGLGCADDSDKPTAIISSTVKGKGLEIAENHPSGMHNAPLTKEQYDNALAALAGRDDA